MSTDSAAVETTWDNPLGIDGFGFIEFAAPDAQVLRDLFERMGFTPVAKHRSKRITIYRQNNIDFLINDEPNSFASEFAHNHGPCVCGFSIRVADPDQAFKAVKKNGATAVTYKMRTLAVSEPAIEGIGSLALYLVSNNPAQTYADYNWLVGHGTTQPGHGLTFVDHLTHNVRRGNMDRWAQYYERLFGFKEIRYFDIKGEYTGLYSRAMTAPDGMVRIPINESADNKSQIAEYLDQYKGEGVQHIALYSDDIYASVEALRTDGMEFLDVPDTYYQSVSERVPNHDEDAERLQTNGILIDADQETKSKKLLQIFTQTVVGPIFFEVIQRKGNQGFGEGNFQALFESIERDQRERGVL